ncbi:hypothetical protein L6164_030130 [Bauhinia variegata]|uniref:Uncharacterized protein n=1 Tax=Bauhinia variegata TaxID=167791 RepID=A0ACB9LBF0_BAUVA|nr:hypothetical protein L6164_030130 [Bauhinia variegata]
MFGIRYSLSSFPVIHDALVELNLITSELGQIALSSSMLNDGIQWVTLAILSVKNSNKDSLSVMFLTCYIGLILVCIFVIRPAFMKLAAKTPPGKPVKEIYIVFILLGVLIMSVLADLIGVTSLQGPLLLGLVMPNGPPLGTALIERTEAIVSNFLLPFFHVYIGFLTDLSTITSWQSFAIIQTIIIASYAAKVVGCMVVARTYNIRVRHGIVLGLILNIKGIVDLMSLARMKKLKVRDESAISQLVLSMVCMTAIITPLIRILYKPNTRLERSTHRGKTRTIQSTARHSEFCIVSCVHNEVNVHSTITLLESCNPTQASPICVYVIHLIEILGKSTPVLIRFDKIGRKSLSVNYPNTSHIMRAFENYSENSSGPVTVLPYIHVAPYKSMHESICNLCEDNSIPFLIVPFHENHQTQGTHLVSSIRDINLNFQAYAPYDREALALGIRIAEREGVKVTLFHVILQQQNKKLNAEEGRKSARSREEAERLLDEGLIDEFKGMMIGNDDVVLSEIEVEDGVEAMDSIRKFEGDYDLVMVGKRHNIGLLRDDEMCSLIENAETLGMYGDMLASTEFCNGMVSVLVLQCGGTRAGGKKKDKAIDPVGGMGGLSPLRYCPLGGRGWS